MPSARLAPLIGRHDVGEIEDIFSPSYVARGGQESSAAPLAHETRKGSNALRTP